MSRRCQTLARVLLVALVLAEAAAAQPALERAPASFRAWVESLPEGRREPLLRRLGEMPTQRRNRLFHRWEALEEGERRQLEAFLEEGNERPFRRRLEQLPPDSREELVRRWRGMGPAERRRMRERLERFRTLSPAEQQALIERRFGTRSPEERARILEALREASEALPQHPPETGPRVIAPDPNP